MQRILGIRIGRSRRIPIFLGLMATLIALLVAPHQVVAQVTAFKQAVAEAASRDQDIATYYRASDYAPIWTEANETQRGRRAALMAAITTAHLHGLPTARYDPEGLMEKLKNVRSPRDRGLAEVEMTRVFLQYARDIQSGVLIPSRIDKLIVRDVPYRDRQGYLKDFVTSDPMLFFRNLRPRTLEYNALMREKLRMEQLLAQGGWGPVVPATSVKPGEQGNSVMEYIVINPTWTVPRSIVTKEYLPSMQRNANAAGHIDLIDGGGRVINRSSVNFSKYNARNFPFGMRQKPGNDNALGLVKFIFPNKYNIYLHDTPSKNLFSRDVRAFSHGCVRLADPFDFAYKLLAAQTDDPVGFFKAKLATKRETFVHLEVELPVHLIYRTAFTTPRGHTQYRADIYGRDARIWDALSKAGVALGDVQG